MDTETVLGQILPAVEQIIKAVVGEMAAAEETRGAATLYVMEERVHAVLPRIGQLIVQALVSGQGAGTAAAISLRSGEPFASLDVRAVQRELKRQGARIE